MPPRKAAKTEKSATATEAKAQRDAAELVERTAWIAANDPLLDLTGAPFTVSELFSNVVQQKTFAAIDETIPSNTPCDWSSFRDVLLQRNATSPRWFIQLRKEDLLLQPDGLRGTVVETFVVAEATEPTLSPAHYVVKEHWPNSDIEDNAPERVLKIADQGLKWVRVVLDNGDDTNTFLLSKPKTVAASSTGATAPAMNFTFGGAPAAPSAPAAAAPVQFGFAAAAAPAAPSFSFGFGAAPAAGAPTPAPAAPMQFGFSAPTAPAAAPAATSFTFGAAAAPLPATPSNTPFDAVAVAKAASPFKKMPATDILFVLWSTTRLKDMIHEFRSGSRIVKEKFPLSSTQSIKLVMQNDLKDRVHQVAEQLLLKTFAKANPEVRAVDKWLDDCPVYDNSLAPHLQKFRAKYLKDIAEDSSDYQKLHKASYETIETALQQMVDVRKELVRAAVEDAEGILAHLKEKKIAEKSTFRLLKYYPKNDIVPFRPFGKVSGISESGEHVNVCEPPMYVFKNTLLKA